MAKSMMMDFSDSDMQDHLDYIFGGTRGYVSLCLLDRNKPKKPPKETFFHWPDQRNELVAAIEVAREIEGQEVFYCPYPLKTRNRVANNSTVRWVVHTDVDSGLSSLLKRQLVSRGFRLVSSGSVGNYHVYGRMSRSLSPEEHRGILIALRAKLGGDNKIADNDLLRIPETTNWKNLIADPAKRNDEPMDVEVEVSGRRRIDVDELVIWLDAKPVQVRDAHKDDTWAVADVSDVNRSLLAAASMPVDEAVSRYGNRHQAVWAVTRDLARAGLDVDQIHTLMDDFPAAIDKADDERGYKVHRDVERALVEFDISEGKELAVVNPDDDDWAETNFWSRRPSLKHISQFAYASTANPWGVLGVVLVRTLYQIPPNVLMPGQNEGKTGTRALNMFVVLVGSTGAGKKTATDAARYAFDMGIIHPSLNLGSGEGISKAYRRRGRTKEEPEIVVKTTKVIFDVAEVTTWNNLAGRQGATLIGEVLKAFSGEALGFSNSDDERTINVEANSYRMCLILGAQPGTAGRLLADHISGLPQRFLWMPTEVDEDKWDQENMPKPPDSEEWVGPEWSGSKDHVLKFPHESKRDRIAARFDASKNPMESQAIVIKMRVAAALAFLDGRANVNEEDWALARIVMLQSRRTRQRVIDYLAEAKRREAVNEGERKGVSRFAEEQQIDKLTAEDVKRVAGVIVNKMQSQGGSLMRGKISHAVSGRDRKHIDAALSWLIEEGKLSRRSNVSGRPGIRYRLRGE